MKRILLAMAIGISAGTAFAQPKSEQAAIKSLCGCYEVDFKYAETFAADTAYKFHPRYHVSGMEWVLAEENTGKKMVLQHLLVADDTTVIKHWREDWEYEKKDWWQFNKDATWQRVENKNPKGQRTQTVWEVDDAPRYQGSSSWITSNGKYYWENTTDAPLPRREYTKRDDYNVMQRTNRIIITDTGWVHEQDNKKIVRTLGIADVSIAEEKGYNTYRKIDDSKCKQAAVYWEKHKQFWSAVRQNWEDAMKNKNSIHLVSKIDGKLLYQQLDVLENETLTAAQLSEKMKQIINAHITAADAKTIAATTPAKGY